MDEDTRLHNSKGLIRVNQSPHLTKDRFAWVILSHVILSALKVNNISSLHIGKGKISLTKIISSGSISIKSQGP